MPDYSLWCYSDILMLFQVVKQPKVCLKVILPKGVSLLSDSCTTSLADSSQYTRKWSVLCAKLDEAQGRSQNRVVAQAQVVLRNVWKVCVRKHALL